MLPDYVKQTYTELKQIIRVLKQEFKLWRLVSEFKEWQIEWQLTGSQNAFNNMHDIKREIIELEKHSKEGFTKTL